MLKNKPAYIFVSGGVISGLGKGTTTASIGMLLKSRGLNVSVVKCENYLNIDSGLINPIEHGDPFLCEDGTEADMDLGTYENFLNQDMGRKNFITMGQVYKRVIDKERNFEYDGEDVEAIPHVTDEIIRRIKESADKNTDIVIAELGGTAGEYQNALYYEASRIMKLRDREKVLHIHVSYLPVPHHIGEPKTKPTQISVKLLNSMGIQPHFIVARSRERIDKRRRERFALFTNVQPEHIIDGPDVPSVYEIPLIFKEQEFDDKILLALGIEAKEADLKAWNEYVKKVSLKKSKTVKVGIVGKYFATGKYDLKDSYAALFDALDHAATNLSYKLDIKWINSETFEKEDDSKLEELDGIIVPIGWGARGVMGKIKAIKYARENKVPYLGLCYGMQLAVVEFARNVLGWKTAQSTEVEEGTNCPVVHIIPDQKRIIENRAYGGTMRLGSWDCIVKEDTICFEAYEKSGQFVDKNKKLTSERHRHRYEFNNQYEKDFEDAGMVIAGKSVKENLVELIELPKKTHPFFVGTQGHPEYKSRPLRPHGLFLSFLTHAAKDRL